MKTQLFTVIACLFCTCYAGAQTVRIYGQFDWGTAIMNGSSASTVAFKNGNTTLSITGTITQGSYQVTSASSTLNVLPGMAISGTGIPDSTVVVNISGTTLLLSKMITAASSPGVALTINSTLASILTAHTNGLGGNLPGYASYTLDSGVNYTFNGSTTKPFPETMAAARVYAGKLTVNTGISVNRQLFVSDTCTLNNGNLTIPVGDTILITSGLPIAGTSFSSVKHIATAADASTGAQGLFGVQSITTSYFLPIGSVNTYLPVSLAPASAASFLAAVFEGVTANGRPNGTALTPLQKQNTVNAVWTLTRTSSNTDSCNVTLIWPQPAEGYNFAQDDSIGVSAYTTAWSTVSGTGNNSVNSATQKFRDFSSFSVGAYGYALGNGPNAAFTAGNLVVSRIGDGTSGPFSGTNNVYLDEYTTAGAYVRSVPLPTTSGTAVLQSNAIEEGRLALSSNNQYLTLVGYSKSASTSAYNNSAVAIPRSIGVVKYDGTINVLVPPITTPVASTSGTVVTGNPTSLTVSSATGIAAGQHVYGSYVPNNATVASVSGTTITLSGSGGTNGGSNFTFMSGATPQFANGKSPGGAITTNGTDYWLCSRETDLQYYSSSTGTLTNIAGGTTGTTARLFNIVDGQLYTSNDYGLKLAKIGTGTPTTTTSTTGLSYASGSFAPVSPAQFCMVDASSTESGSDVLYVTETGSNTGAYGILKYSKVSGLWTSNGGYGSYTDVYEGLTGVLNGSTVTLYAIRKSATSAGGELVKITDAGTYNTTMSGTESILAAYNTSSNLGGSWRSIAFAPTSTGGNQVLAIPSNNLVAQLEPSTVRVSWNDTEIVNTAGFNIEKSIDGKSFSYLGHVETIAGSHNYSYNDYALPIDKSYYRLRIIQQDGSFTYSGVAVVKAGTITNSNLLRLYPDPVTDYVIIEHAVTPNTMVLLYDLPGRLLQKQPLTATGTRLNTATLPPGVYIITLSNGTSSISQKFVKK